MATSKHFLEFRNSQDKLLKEQRWSELLDHCDKYRNLLSTWPELWKSYGLAYHNLKQHKLAFSAFSHAYQLNRNDIETAKLLATTCCLLRRTDIFANFVNTEVPLMPQKMQNQFLDYVESDWTGFIDFSHYFIPEVLHQMYRRRDSRNQDYDKDLRTLGFDRINDPFQRLLKSLEAGRPDLFSHILTQLQDELPNTDPHRLNELIMHLLEDHKIQFEELPRKIQIFIMESAAQAVASQVAQTAGTPARRPASRGALTSPAPMKGAPAEMPGTAENRSKTAPKGTSEVASADHAATSTQDDESPEIYELRRELFEAKQDQMLRAFGLVHLFNRSGSSEDRKVGPQTFELWLQGYHLKIVETTDSRLIAGGWSQPEPKTLKDNRKRNLATVRLSDTKSIVEIVSRPFRGLSKRDAENIPTHLASQLCFVQHKKLSVTVVQVIDLKSLKSEIFRFEGLKTNIDEAFANSRHVVRWEDYLNWISEQHRHLAEIFESSEQSGCWFQNDFSKAVIDQLARQLRKIFYP